MANMYSGIHPHDGCTHTVADDVCQVQDPWHLASGVQMRFTNFTVTDYFFRFAALVETEKIYRCRLSSGQCNLVRCRSRFSIWILEIEEIKVHKTSKFMHPIHASFSHVKTQTSLQASLHPTCLSCFIQEEKGG
jgi:hypothetical protein